MIITCTCRHKTKFILSEAVFLPGFRTLGTTGPKDKLRGGHEGETEQVTIIFRYS